MGGGWEARVLRLISPGGVALTYREPAPMAYVTERRRLDQALAAMAEAARGADPDGVEGHRVAGGCARRGGHGPLGGMLRGEIPGRGGACRACSGEPSPPIWRGPARRCATG